MKYFKLGQEVFAFSTAYLHLVQEGMIEMLDEEIDRHINPEKYLSDIEKVQLKRKNMPTLSPIEFDIKLNDNGLYDAVQAMIKDNFEMRIAYTRAIFFSRTDPFIDQASIALGLTDDQVDAMWEQALTL